MTDSYDLGPILNRLAYCPECGYRGECHYRVFPTPARIRYMDGAADTTEHIGRAKDYKCHNCDAEWILVTESPE